MRFQTRETTSLGSSQWSFSVHPRKEPVQASHSFLFFNHIQLKFWKMSSWHYSFLASAVLFGLRQDTLDKSLPQFNQVVGGHLETPSESSRGKVRQEGAADPKGLTHSKSMEEHLRNPSYLCQFHFLWDPKPGTLLHPHFPCGARVPLTLSSLEMCHLWSQRYLHTEPG